MAFTVKTPTSDAAWRPDHFAFAPTDAVPDAAILQTSTPAGSIEGDAPSVRVAFVTDDEADFIAEAEDIPEAEPALSEALIYTGKISQLVRVSREQWLQPSTSEQLAQSVARAIVRRADIAYLNEPPPTPPAVQPVAGLLNVENVVDGGEIDTDLDLLVDLIATLQTNLATPSHLVLSPTAWAEFRKLKVAASYNQSLVGAGVTDAREMLLSLPVLVNLGMPAYAGLVIDQTAVVSATGQVNVSSSEHRYFDSDSVALRATWRIGHTVPRPNPAGLLHDCWWWLVEELARPVTQARRVMWGRRANLSSSRSWSETRTRRRLRSRAGPGCGGGPGHNGQCLPAATRCVLVGHAGSSRRAGQGQVLVAVLTPTAAGTWANGDGCCD